MIVIQNVNSFRPFFSAVDKSSEDILRERFTQMNIDLEAFSSLRYIGIQTQQPPTDYSHIKNALHLEIENTAVRSPRQPDVIYKAIDVSIRLPGIQFKSDLSEVVCLFAGFESKIFGKNLGEII